MNLIIQDKVLPWVGSIVMEEFDKSNVGHAFSLEMKFYKHLRERNVYKLTLYLAFCIQEWPNIDSCPLDINVIRDAVNIIGS
jgi:hypothetical protein